VQCGCAKFIASETVRAEDAEARFTELEAENTSLRSALRATLDYWQSTGFADCEPDCVCVVDAVRAALEDTTGGVLPV